MKKLKLTKVMASLLIAVSVLVLNPIGASAEWEKDNAGWCYKEENSYVTGWKLIDGKWYYFGYLCYMVSDGYVDGYYLDSNGVWTKNANYTISDIGKGGLITGKSGKQYGRAAGFRGICGTINGEPCLTTYTQGYNNDTLKRYVGFNTLNIYDENNNVVDTVRLPGNTNSISTTYSQNINSQIITFADKNLEQVVRDTINKPIGILYKSDVEKITELAVRNKNISKISGIENLMNLKVLDLGYNEISDISALKALTNLQQLSLNGNQVSDISVLKVLTNLQELSLRSSQISDISSLKALTNLQTLTLDSSQASDISALKELTNLQTLTLFDDQASDISVLKELTNLKTLYLYGRKISDISPLKSLTNLQELCFSGTQVSDISPLQSLTNLQELNIGFSPISNIRPLKSLTNLKELALYSDEISDINQLKELTNLKYLEFNKNKIKNINQQSLKALYDALPNCNILFNDKVE